MTIKQAAKRWGTDDEQIIYSICHDGLEACCWFDKRKIDYYEFQGADSYSDFFDGYAGIFEQDCRRIFRPGDIFLDKFYVLDCRDAYFKISKEYRPILLHPGEVKIRVKACREFENKFGLVPTYSSIITVKDKHTFFYNGELLSFGVIQKEVIRILIEAKQKNLGWVNGKILLDKAGSNATRMRDLFKGNQTWKELIDSDKRGHYRLYENITIEYLNTEEKAA